MPASEVMHKWKLGQEHSGSKHGPIVPHTKKGQKQAIAIMLSEKRAEGEDVPPKRGKKPSRRKR